MNTISLFLVDTVTLPYTITAACLERANLVDYIYGYNCKNVKINTKSLNSAQTSDAIYDWILNYRSYKAMIVLQEITKTIANVFFFQFFCLQARLVARNIYKAR